MARKKSETNEVKFETSPYEASLESSTPINVPYTTEEAQYRDFLLRLMESDRDVREQKHDEFNNMTYTERYTANMKGGNSYTPPRKNPEDTQVVTGTTREKVLAVVSNVVNLNFETRFKAFNTDDQEDTELGEAMSDCVFRANQIEQWEDKKLYAYWELAVQGDVFLEDVYVEEIKVDKKKIPLSSLTSEMFQNYDFGAAMKTIFTGCRRNILAGPQVYLGNIRERDIKKQPRVFTREILPYEVAKTIFGHLPRWKFVPRNYTTSTSGQDDNHWGLNWRLGDIERDMVEVIKYQDDPNDEYQIFLNGVMQLPVGFPKPWEFDGYNIVQGSLEPISAFFAYSKSMPDKTKLDQEILDEMYRLSILKAQKSFMPPIANYSGQLLSRSMFLPGKVTNNLQKGDIEVLGGNPNAYALQPGEFQMIEMIKKFIDEKTVNPITQGINPEGDPTATEVSTVVQQAKQRLGIVIFGFMQLHLNLDTLRLYNVLDNYTKPIGDKVNALKTGLEKKYKTVTVERSMGEQGYGVKKIQFTPDLKPPRDLYAEANGLTFDEGGNVIDENPPKRPMKITQINPEVLRNIPMRWYGEVEITEKESSAQERVLFTDQLVTAAKLFGLPSINQEYAKVQWAQKNKIDARSFFTKNTAEPGSNMVPAAEDVQKMEESPLTKQLRSNPDGPKQAVRQGYGSA